MVTRTRTLILACCIWVTLGLVLPTFAETWNGLKPAGVPLGFWIAAQGAPLALAALALALASSSRPVPPKPAPTAPARQFA